ncbi:MAG: VCBS repeat-containing protein [Bacteroidota bacterium]
MNRGIHIVTIILLLGLLGACDQSNSLFKEVNGKKLGVRFINSVGQNDVYNILTSEHLYNGGGVAIEDFNNDGLQDIFFTGNLVENKLFLNLGDLDFVDISESAGITAPNNWCSGVSIVDINNDGWKDIYVSSTMSGNPDSRTNKFFINHGVDQNGNPRFEDQAKAMGLADAGYTTQAVFFDYDRDDDLDVYLLTNQLEVRAPNKFFFKRTDGSAPNTDRLYRNNGDGSFSNVSSEAGITIEGYGLGINVFDINQDGWLDVYVSNDYLSNDLLYINNQDGTFSNKASEYFKHQAHSSMGCDVADINNDGLPDIVSLEMLPNKMTRRKQMWGASSLSKSQNNDKLGYEYQYLRNTLQINQGLGENGEVKFGDVSLHAGLYATEWSWAALFNDYDADGRKDLFISNGFPKDITDMDFVAFKSSTNLATSRQALLEALPEAKVRNFFYRNTGDLKFKDVSTDWGIEEKSFSNGAAYGDLDNDGDLDIVINNINDNASFLINQSKNINYLQISLKDEFGGAKAFGAHVDIFHEDNIQSQHFMPVRGYISSVQSVLFFGLGEQTKVDSIRIRWADGSQQIEGSQAANQKIEINFKGGERKSIQAKALPFVEVKEEIKYQHLESPFIDFTVQMLLPKQYSRLGPSLSIGDVDNNGEEDFIVGGSSVDVGKLFLSKNGSFEQKNIETYDLILRQEDVGSLLFDADNDQDLDLYIVGGGFESDPDDPNYEDRLMINDGTGKFSRTFRRIPQIKTSGSVVKGADYDKDGDIDLFIGGRILPKAYPSPVSSFLLRNDFEGKDKPRFADASAESFPALENIGMVTDANWSDFDGDGWIDLVLLGEWMSPRFFKNNQGKFEDVTQASGLASYVGWWTSLTAGDFDNDGDTDYMAGNLGTNSFFQASDSMPLYIYGKDFDGNGGYDAFMASKMGYEDGKLYPLHPWDEMQKQMNFLRKKVIKYEDYARSSITDLFDPEQLDAALVYKATHLKSSYLENQGNGKFLVKELPLEAQLAPIQAMLSLDLNEDSYLDVILVGNDYTGELFSGRYDALNGLVLYGNGKGSFQPANYTKTGFLVDGDARALATYPDPSGKMRLLSSQNRSPLSFFEAKAEQKFIKLKALDSWAEIVFEDGSKRRLELNYGSSGISQSSRHLFLPKNYSGLKIYNSKGEVSYESAD